MPIPAFEDANRAAVVHWKHFHKIGDRYGVLRVSRILMRGVMLNVFGFGVFGLFAHN